MLEEAVSYPLLCHAEFYCWILLPFDLGRRGLFTVLTAAGAILLLFITSPLAVRKRVVFLMTAAYFIGASVGIFTKYLFEVDQGFVFSYLACTTIGIGAFWVGAMLTRQRGLFNRCVTVSYIHMFIWLAIASKVFGGHIARWMPLVWIVLACYMGYIVVYSKEVVYDARFGDVDFVNRAFTHLFHFPAILGHYTRLRVAAAIGQYKQKKH